MNHLIVVVTVLSITIGIFVGALIVWFIYFWRRRQIVDSLIRPEDIVGLYGTVEIPFDNNSKGKVRVNLKGSMVDLFAVTDESTHFNVSDRVFIIQMKGNKVWVVGEDSISVNS
jgi:hypothetical protein